MFEALFVLFILLNIVDDYTTYLTVKNGAVEGNPIVKLLLKHGKTGWGIMIVLEILLTVILWLNRQVWLITLLTIPLIWVVLII